MNIWVYNFVYRTRDRIATTCMYNIQFIYGRKKRRNLKYMQLHNYATGVCNKTMIKKKHNIIQVQ